MDTAIAVLSFLVVPALYFWGVRRAIRINDQVVLAVYLLFMVGALRLSLHFAGVPPLRLF